MIRACTWFAWCSQMSSSHTAKQPATISARQCRNTDLQVYTPTSSGVFVLAVGKKHLRLVGLQVFDFALRISRRLSSVP